MVTTGIRSRFARMRERRPAFWRMQLQIPVAWGYNLLGMSDVSRILSAIEAGDPHAASQLLPLVYDELRKLAAANLAREKPGQTLDATALVHEAYIRLVASDGRASSREADVQSASTSGLRLDARPEFANRRHFFAAAAEAMRRILVENARRKQREIHGGGVLRRDLDHLDVAAPQAPDDLLALDESLRKLASADPVAAQLVELRYFAGMTIPQAAEQMNLSPRTADRLWAYARAFLHAEIYGER